MLNVLLFLETNCFKNVNVSTQMLKYFILADKKKLNYLVKACALRGTV
jgi:hypothetical protein